MSAIKKEGIGNLERVDEEFRFRINILSAITFITLNKKNFSEFDALKIISEHDAKMVSLVETIKLACYLSRSYLDNAQMLEIVKHATEQGAELDVFDSVEDFIEFNKVFTAAYAWYMRFRPDMAKAWKYGDVDEKTVQFLYNILRNERDS